MNRRISIMAIAQEIVNSACYMRGVMEVASRKNLVTIGLFAMLSLSSVSSFSPAYAQSTEIYVSPESNIFYSGTTPVGSRFNVTLLVSNVSDLSSYQIGLLYDSTLLNATRAWIPLWDNKWVFFGRTIFSPPSFFQPGRLVIGGLLYPYQQPTFAGSGSLCIIELEIVVEPQENGELFSSLNINNADTYLLDSYVNEIPAIKTGGHYEMRASTYSLTISATVGGTTDPAPGTYSCAVNSEISVSAIPDADYLFDHWELDDANVGSVNPYTVLMDRKHILKAVLSPVPPPQHALTVCSVPTGVRFTAVWWSSTHEHNRAPDYSMVIAYTCWSGTFDESTSVSVIMPEMHGIGEARYYWSQWNDGPAESARIVRMNENISLTAVYSGPYYELSVASLSVTGLPFIIDGVPNTTQYTEWLMEGSYTLEMPKTYNEFIWSHWLEDGDTNRTRIVNLDRGINLTAVFSLLGDLNRDGKVDIKDLAVAAVTYGSYLGHPRWNPETDLNEDNRIDIRDLALIARNFGKTLL